MMYPIHFWPPAGKPASVTRGHQQPKKTRIQSYRHRLWSVTECPRLTSMFTSSKSYIFQFKISFTISRAREGGYLCFKTEGTSDYVVCTIGVYIANIATIEQTPALSNKPHLIMLIIMPPTITSYVCYQCYIRPIIKDKCQF